MFGRLLNSLPLKTLRGYEHPELVEMVFQKTLAYEPTEAMPEMAGISTVLDFGGGCGAHYKDAALTAANIRWAIVETAPMVRRAKELETNSLKFFTDAQEAASWLGELDVVHSNGALQYAADPINKAKELCDLRPKHLLWYRLLMGDGRKLSQISPLGDNGPGKQRIALKRVVFDRTTIREDQFLSAHQGYRLEARGPDWFKFSR
ncbi:hypothetical protein JQ543_02610 [Bradyrhizobium diazoefficiens]|nr:hypothetical protein [Bradyrhizobium diazoefficiens]MBR0846621.1 hypothetical protein [Bradyrhizobium diazoefficiens]